MQLVDFVLRLVEDVVLALRDDDVADRHGRTGKRRVVEAKLLDRIEELRRLRVTVLAIAIGDELLERALVDDLVDERVFHEVGNARLKITRPMVVLISSPFQRT